ncbi:MAG: molybdopterin-dependent oxidoreductase [Candidatus Dormibacteraeota bacterium]|nr:molybdopterin-dependent oxidoreductase [Candidatus Dormibacteraeota bacterium]
MGGRRTNLALLGLLAAAFLTGWLAFSFNSWSSRLVLVVHAVAGIAIIGLLPWKSLLARRSLIRRSGSGWLVGLLLALLLLVSLAFGLLHSGGLPYLWTSPLLSSVPVLRELTAMDLHVGAAIALLPFAIWHVIVRPVRARTTDLSRRAVLRVGLLLGASAVSLAVLPAGRRGLTGSCRLDALPVTSWLFDPVPAFDIGNWSLLAGSRRWSYAELAAHADRVRAVIDCTGGWYSEQEWEGVWLSRLLPAGELAGALSISVRSATGYPRRFDVADLSGLLLATRVGGAELTPGNGYPVRLVAPGKRGFWWVKWLVELRPEPVPWWWQSPYPLQ